MKIIGKKLSLAEFIDYVNKKDFGKLPPTFLVVHHTWKPTKSEWDGSTTISALKKYYEGLGWIAGPHLFVAEDGIWLFTDMYEVGIHAGSGNGTEKTGYSIGIEVVGDYDKEVWGGKTKENALGVIKVLQEKLKIKDSGIHFHREYSAKSCPGNAITMDWLLGQLRKDNVAEAEFDYKGNLDKIFGAVESLLGREDGQNPSDSETESILEDLAEVKKRLDSTQIKTVTIEKPVEKIEVLDDALKKSISKIVGEDYGNFWNEKEQKKIADILTEYVSEIEDLRKMSEDSLAKAREIGTDLQEEVDALKIQVEVQEETIEDLEKNKKTIVEKIKNIFGF